MEFIRLRAILEWALPLIACCIALYVAFAAVTHRIEYSRIGSDEVIYQGGGAVWMEIFSLPVEQRWEKALEYRHSIEHPNLSKLIAGALYTQLDVRDRKTQVQIGRWLSFLYYFGSALLLCYFSPWCSALFLSVPYGWSMGGGFGLDAGFVFYALASLVLLDIAQLTSRVLPLALCAVTAGLAVATKYTAIIPLFSAGIVFLMYTRRWIASVAMLVTSIAIFFLANPQFLGDPFSTVMTSYKFHGTFSSATSQIVVRDSWYSLRTLFRSPMSWWTTIVSWAGLIGVVVAWRRSPPVVLWIILGAIALYCWKLKWFHYAYLILAPLAISAGLLVEEALRWSYAQVYRSRSALR
ncbi:MAG: hypothetical protein EBZ48_02355 [Proteobacteria bacterium]|nr:hypothetical protein [Pseudomonadota bacterium]